MTPEEKKKVRILVVDDEQVIRKLLRLVMDKQGCGEVDEAESGEKAVAALRRNDYHVVFLDKNMPGTGSFQDVDLGKVTERITDNSTKLQALADRLKEMKRKKEES